MQQYQIGDYPIVIEPTVDMLEVTGAAEDQETRWVQLHRVPTQVVLNSLPFLQNGLAHFFGRSSEFDTNNFLLAYNCTGLLSGIVRRNNLSQWDCVDIPAEITGEPVSNPSVRLTFKTERARNAFLRYLTQIAEKKVHNPSLGIVLDQLAEPIRVVPVQKLT